MKCPICHAPLERNANFCTACGARVEKPGAVMNYCTRCGLQLKQEYVFCPGCGRDLREDLVPAGGQISQMSPIELPSRGEVISVSVSDEMPSSFRPDLPSSPDRKEAVSLPPLRSERKKGPVSSAPQKAASSFLNRFQMSAPDMPGEISFDVSAGIDKNISGAVIKALRSMLEQK